MIYIICLAIISYLLGSLNFSIILSKALYAKDVRKSGSHNAGLTNYYRTMGKKGTIAVILGDIIKCLPAVILGKFVFGLCGYNATLGMILAGIFVTIGHIFPIYFGFKGGKGMLVSAACVLFIDWRVFLIGLVFFVMVVFFTRYVSLGSITTVIVVPPIFLLFGYPWYITVSSLTFTLIVVICHLPNIKRLINKTESKFKLKKETDN